MATIPTPRSYSQIIGDMLDAFLSKTGLPTVKVGSPVLSIFEAAAQSDLRSSQDIFTMLSSISLDRAEKVALDRTGGDEDLPRLVETAASGFVTIGDSAFVKVSTVIFQGQPAPIVGSASVFVLDASAFPSSGSLYLGRGTTNYEGPLAYTATTNLGTYWRIDLNVANKTQIFHDLGETVVLAQGGNRAIPAGTLVQTPQGNVSQSVQFSTLYAAVVPDGETSVNQVQVTAQKTGISGNVPAGNINGFVTKPFTTATATNPLPFTNAQPAESDKSYRERIRAARQSRTKGTALAIKTAVLGITSADENKRVTSAQVVSNQGAPTTLYIDDGTGYEENSEGIAVESVVDSAFGGEQFFQVDADRPVTKAFVETTLSAPFALASGMVLAVEVGGVLYKHTFSADEFRNIGNADAFECVASINADSTIAFQARTLGGGTQFAIVAKADTDEDLEVTAPDTDEVDANEVLGFPIGRQDTMRLYKNDRLLSKDGQIASLESEAQNLWASMTTGMTLLISVDHTPIVTYTFNNIDFVNAGTIYTTVSSSNSLAAWAAVFNAKIPGITTAVTAGRLTLTSNKGASAVADITITGGTLVTGGKMFNFGSAAQLESTGRNNDYTLDRNTGQLRLEQVLSSGDRLSIGTANTRSFIESTSLSPLTLAVDALMWFTVDAGALLVPTLIGPTTTVTISNSAESWGDRVRYTASSGVFVNIAVGDWAIVLDTGFSGSNQGAWRVARTDAGFTWFEVERASAATTDTSVPMSHGGIVFARTSDPLILVDIPLGTNYTASSIVDAFNTAAFNTAITAEVYRTTRWRARTNSFQPDGDIALLAQNQEAQKLGMTAGNSISNLTSHLASVRSGNPDSGTPTFVQHNVVSVSSANVFVADSTTELDPSMFVNGLRNLADAAGARSRYGTNNGYEFETASISGSTITMRLNSVEGWLPQDRFYASRPYALSALDDLTVLIDGDVSSHRYAMNLFRKVKPTSSTYGSSNSFTDADNGNQSLAVGFGLAFDFSDFAVFMHARAKSHAESGDTTKTILWRSTRFGPDGNSVKVRYVYPTAPSSPVSVTVEPFVSNSLATTTFASVGLATDVARTGTTIRNTSRIGQMAATVGSLQRLTWILGYSITSATREVVLNYTARGATAFTGTVTGAISGATGTVDTDSRPGGTGGAGFLLLSAVTGTFNVGETINGTTGTATSSGGQTGLTTLTLDVATPGASAGSGFNPGDQIWVKSSSGLFSAGVHTLTAVPSASTIQYQESTNSAVATPNIGTVSFDSQGEVTLSGSTVALNDIFYQGTTTSGTSLDDHYSVPVRITALGNQYFSGIANSTATVAVPTWNKVVNASVLKFYPLLSASNAANMIATAVNTLAAVANTTTPVTAVAVGVGGTNTGIVSQSSDEEFATPFYGYSLTDGMNWVLVPTFPIDTSHQYTFSFKRVITASLATNSDWANEDVRLVPMTAKNVSAYLGATAVSGLGSAAEVVDIANDLNTDVQITSLTLGSTGSVQVQGGRGNAASAAVIGSATPLSTTNMLVSIAAADAQALAGDMWVDVQNTSTLPRAQRFTASTVFSTIDALGNITLTGTNAWDFGNAAAAVVDGISWQIEIQGRYVAFVWSGGGSTPSLNGVAEGQWVQITTQGGTISSRNTGLFRIVRSNDTTHTFWIENPNAAAEIVTCGLLFLTSTSVMPGDQLIISTPLFGASNQGIFTVDTIDRTNVHKFKLVHTMTVYSGITALGSSFPLVQCIEAVPSKLVKQILSICNNPTNGSLADVKFKTQAGYATVGETVNTLLIALDKLDFPVSIVTGIDGYAHSIGLIGEAARILYGVERDPATYPGVVAAGANVNISGPLVKRVQVALAIRVISGAPTQAVIARVKSAVAALINATGVGVPIAISDIVDAAASVNGVAAVSIVSPTYDATHDLIPVQPQEKPLVLNLDQDVQVSLVGVV